MPAIVPRLNSPPLQGDELIAEIDKGGAFAFAAESEIEEALATAFRSFVHCVKYMDPSGLERAFTLAHRLFVETPCHRMHFTESAAFWPRIASLEQRRLGGFTRSPIDRE